MKKIIDFLKNITIYRNKYHTHSDAIIISCFYNPQDSPYRITAFNTFYNSIKHLNHHIIECVIGDAEPQLENETSNITRVYTESLLWHKESLLNKIISELPEKYKYVFWVDADVIFTNKNWLVDSVEELQTKNIIQPFEYCVHLEKDELKPSFSMKEILMSSFPNKRNNKVWRSFCSNYATNELWKDENYNNHGHVGFAWGAKREVLEEVPLYDKALIGGADHIIAHASVGQINYCCISKSFTDNIDEINEWSKKFYKVTNGKVGYVKGELYHIWHGDIAKRQYFKRVQDFTSKTKAITMRDNNGLYVTKNKEDEEYMKHYFKQREVPKDDGFLTSMALGYATDDGLLGGALGGNMLGGIVGDMLNDNDSNNHTHTPTPEPDILNGGEFGGGGAEGTWDNNESADNTDNTDNNPFS